MNHNHANFQRRLDFIESLLSRDFGIMEPVDIVPLQYDAECPFKFNNFVYHVSLSSPLPTRRARDGHRPGCVPIPGDTREFIIRLTNADAEGMSTLNRVENEVAIISLAAVALASFQPHVVPAVYDWCSAAAESSQGWILQEMMPGTPLDESLPKMSLVQKQRIFEQMAQFLGALQRFELPPSINGFGGVTFGCDGQLLSAALPNGSGPWPTLEATYAERFKVALTAADENPYIQGWRARGIRDRLEKYVEGILAAQLASVSGKEDRVIVHGDFTTNNLLYDGATGRITALLDYDFAAIAHPSSEFFSSFGEFGGQLEGWSPDEPDAQVTLRNAQLHGFHASPQATVSEEVWDVAKAWEAELEKLGVRRPRTIDGIDSLADVETLLSAILPWRITNSDKLRLLSKEEILQTRKDSETRLLKLLDYFCGHEA